MNVKEIRRNNLRMLARSVGGVTCLAERLARSQSQISHLIGTNPVKNIGDKLAAEVERVFEKPIGWLDHSQFTIQDHEGIYDPHAKRPFSQVPLLAWNDLFAWLDTTTKSTKQPSQYVVTQITVSEHAFALHVDGDSMEAAHGVSFSDHSMIIVDPEVRAYNGAFVLARQNPASQIVFKQLILDGNRRYLKPLNPRYPIIEITAQAIICGVVRLMMKEFPVK